MPYYSVWVGGLKAVVQEKDLTDIFSPYGDILNVKVVRDPETHRSKHCGFVVFGNEATAENAANRTNGKTVLGGSIHTRGPNEQRQRGYTGTYDGKIGYVPSKDNDQRQYTDCMHYISSSCTNGHECPYRHNPFAKGSYTPVCEKWLSKNCTDVNCPKKHPNPNAVNAAAPNASDDSVEPRYRLGDLQIDDDEDIITLASGEEYTKISQKFRDDWVKGDPPGVRAIFVIKNEPLVRRWKRYKSSLPSHYQNEEEHYHGTKISCDISVNEDLCSAWDCRICQISEKGFDAVKISTNIPNFQRFGRGFYLAPNSSKCHDYTQGAHTYRAMLLCTICPGNKYTLTKNDTSSSGPPTGYHSIFGQSGASLNYKEIVVHSADAILPKYIIVYRKDREHKIAK